ncbi:hypothetical protein ACFQ0T_39805 [Kitasatospora gansuensis]
MAVGVVEFDGVLVDRDHHDVVVTAVGVRCAGLVEQQAHVHRTDQDRPPRAGGPQPFQRLGRRASVTALAAPAQLGDRGVEAELGVPSVRIEQRQGTGDELGAER